MDLPFKEITKYPKHIDANTIIQRTLEGLGYRLYWATEALRKEDLVYRPSPESMSSWETLEHIAYLMKILESAFSQKAMERGVVPQLHSLEEFRAYSLGILKEIVQGLQGESYDDLEQIKIRYATAHSTMEYPFWHLLNGPISDALYHIGQIVSFRRTSGNPIHEKVNVFMGKNRP